MPNVVFGDNPLKDNPLKNVLYGTSLIIYDFLILLRWLFTIFKMLKKVNCENSKFFIKQTIVKCDICMLELLLNTNINQ